MKNLISRYSKRRKLESGKEYWYGNLLEEGPLKKSNQRRGNYIKIDEKQVFRMRTELKWLSFLSNRKHLCDSDEFSDFVT